jgi:hypothetical protein
LSATADDPTPIRWPSAAEEAQLAREAYGSMTFEEKVRAVEELLYVADLLTAGTPAHEGARREAARIEEEGRARLLEFLRARLRDSSG